MHRISRRKIQKKTPRHNRSKDKPNLDEVNKINSLQPSQSPGKIKGPTTKNRNVSKCETLEGWAQDKDFDPRAQMEVEDDDLSDHDSPSGL